MNLASAIGGEKKIINERIMMGKTQKYKIKIKMKIKGMIKIEKKKMKKIRSTYINK